MKLVVELCDTVKVSGNDKQVHHESDCAWRKSGKMLAYAHILPAYKI